MNTLKILGVLCFGLMSVQTQAIFGLGSSKPAPAVKTDTTPKLTGTLAYAQYVNAKDAGKPTDMIRTILLAAGIPSKTVEKAIYDLGTFDANNITPEQVKDTVINNLKNSLIAKGVTKQVLAAIMPQLNTKLPALFKDA